jgi:prolyl 4-hydroxylase
LQNYTDTGFKKVRAPQRVFELLSNHWKNNQDNKEKEVWPTGNTYVNYWKAPTYMVNVEDSKLRGAGYNLKRKIWEGVKPILEEWTGMELEPSSMYGVREYTRGAILAPHADRMPLISSCIINVAQDVEEDWPLEVFGRDGLAYNVTMQPGDMVLYESHSLIHGRPFPLKGNYFANIFIHFRPTGKLLRERDAPVQTDDSSEGMPMWILPYSPESSKWLRDHGKTVVESPAAAPLDEIPHAAQVGDLDILSYYATDAEKKHLLHKKDENGWKPIHEAARGGHQDVIELLIKYGADVNERTGRYSDGDSVLRLVVQNHGSDHPLAQYLRDLGAVELGEEL